MTIGAGWYLVHEIFSAFTRITEGWGGVKGNPHIQKTECFIPEFLLVKETVHMNWESGVQVRWGTGKVGVWACWYLAPKKFIISTRRWLWTWIPDNLIPFLTLSQVSDLQEPFIHFYSFPPTSAFERKQGWVAPISKAHSELESSFKNPSEQIVTVRCQPELHISTSLESFWREISISGPQTLVCITLPWNTSLILGNQ